MINFSKRLTVREGHDGSTVNKPRRKVHWAGTVAEYWDMNAHLPLADMRRRLAALDRDGFYNIGGGPAAMAYVVRPDEC